MALITGGNTGIGLATAHGLLRRGARVILACRSAMRAQRAVYHLSTTAGHKISWIRCDLADLTSVRTCADRVASRYGALDLLIHNAAVFPSAYATMEPGVELAFGVNVLSTALLTRRLLDLQALGPRARVVWLTHDRYVLADDCTPDVRYTGRRGARRTYLRSKLGTQWLRHAFETRWPDRGWYTAYPGPVASDLVNVPLVPRWFKTRLLQSPEQGARAPLYCATEPDLPSGYVHHALGMMDLTDDDPAMNHAGAERLYAACMAHLTPHLAATGPS